MSVPRWWRCPVTTRATTPKAKHRQKAVVASSDSVAVTAAPRSASLSGTDRRKEEIGGGGRQGYLTQCTQRAAHKGLPSQGDSLPARTDPPIVARAWRGSKGKGDDPVDS